MSRLTTKYNEVVGILEDGAIFVLEEAFKYDDGFHGATHYTMYPMTQDDIDSRADEEEEQALCMDLWQQRVADGIETRGLEEFTDSVREELESDQYFIGDDPSFRGDMDEAVEKMTPEVRAKFEAEVGVKGKDFVDWDCSSCGRIGKDELHFKTLLRPDLLEVIKEAEA